MTRYWVIAPYDSQRPAIFEAAWSFDTTHGTIAIGWPQLGDPSELDRHELDELHRRTYPGTPEGGANSPWVLATHTIGNARAWVFGIAAAPPVSRDRPPEFASTGDDVAQFRAEGRGALQRDRGRAREHVCARSRPAPAAPAELWGEGMPHEISVRDAFLHVIEHASLHLGHLELTRQLSIQR